MPLVDDPARACAMRAALAEHAQFPLAYVDDGLRVAYANTAFARVLGRTADDVVDAPMATLLADAAWLGALQQALATGAPVVREGDLRGREAPADGPTSWTWHVVPDRAADGSVRGLVLSGRDTTDEARAREQARSEAERLRLALDAGQMALWEWDLTTGQVIWNDNHYRMLGYEPGSVEPTYQRWAERVHPDDLRAVEQLIRDRIAGGGDYVSEYRTLWPDGTIRWVEARGRIWGGADGRPRRQYGVMLDITERKQTEEALRVSDRRKSEFLAALSHELRNPLAPITSSLYLLERVPADGAAAQRALEVIRRQVSHLTRLVDDLLDITRIARNKMRVERAPVELAALVRATAEDHRALFERAGVALAVDVRVGPLAVLGDEHRLAQVIGNLLNNAAKFTPRGGHARVSTGTEEGVGVVRVVDDGAGMTPEMLARAFEPFVQGEVTIDRATGGLGLGLALARSIVELLGGTLEAHSAGPGTGATFVLRLPLAHAGAAAGSAATPDAPARRRVLIVEDNVDAAEMLATVLRLDGHEVRVAHDGVAGLAAVRANPPDVVLCDLGLPGMDGYEVARAVRAEPVLASVYLVALSGYARPEDRERAHAAGFDAHLAKPLAQPALAALLRDLPTRSPTGAG
jgi:PAS domain S-box-containing protein